MDDSIKKQKKKKPDHDQGRKNTPIKPTRTDMQSPNHYVVNYRPVTE